MEDAEQPQQEDDEAEAQKPSSPHVVQHTSSHNGLLKSFKERECRIDQEPDAQMKTKNQQDGQELATDKNKEEKEGNNYKKRLPMLTPVSYDGLAASGTLHWKHCLFSPVQTFHKIRHAKEEVSLLTPSLSLPSLRQGVTLPMIGEVKWEDLKTSLKSWLRNPKNLALLLWGTAVGVSGAILFLVMVGLLDHAIQSKGERDAWFEANNQVLNALFALMCLYLHPQRLLHLFLLYRWQPNDIKKLREVYCKDGKYKPHEWTNMLVVVLLLNLNCFAQYALCGLNWGYRRSDRPPLGIGLCLAVAIGAPAAAGIYTNLSPLGKDFEEDQEHLEGREKSEGLLERKLSQKPSLKIGRAWRLSKKCSFVDRDGKPVNKPEWRGGLFDFKSDPQVTLATALCGFCVFGFNMERLGFGNRFVHIVTFILLCTAPYWIFFLAATNIDDGYVRRGLSYGGIVLCVFGLLYGGFWRIQMRKTFGLPPQKWCFGKAALTDCTQWLFCSVCSLCQEVRTSEYYKVFDNKFYMRDQVLPPSYRSSPRLSPLGRQTSDASSLHVSVVAIDLANQTPEESQGCSEILVDKHEMMNPPVPLILVK